MNKQKGYNPPPKDEKNMVPDPVPDPHGIREEVEDRVLMAFREVMEFLYLYEIHIKPDVGITENSGVELEWELEDKCGVRIVINFIPSQEDNYCKIEYAVLKPGIADGGPVNNMHQLVRKLRSCGVWKLISNKGVGL